MADLLKFCYSGDGMLELLKKYFGYESFRPLQEDIIGRVLEGKDCVALMPTGGGKSLCYQLPALILPGITIVISPLISLMKDQVDQLLANGIATVFINSTLSQAQMRRAEEAALSGEIKILYIAPERLRAAGFEEFLKSLKVDLIAIDEAHCISEWGHDFRPDYRNLKILREYFPDAPVIALTATATDKVRLDIVSQMSLKNPNIFIASFNRPNLNYSVLPKRNFAARLLQLLEKYKNQSAILYCFSRKGAEDLAETLRLEGYAAAAYHAGLNAETRKEVQEKFIRDEINIITATIAFGMGINKPDVRLVAHCDLPKSIEGYYQETGRAGRDGLAAECVLFFSYADKRKHAYFIDEIEDETEREKAWKRLQEVLTYGDLPVCRRKYLLHYFGEEYREENCGACDICLKTTPQFNATELAQKILSAVIRTGERFGASYIAKVLTGEKDERIENLGHHGLSVFGIVRDVNKRELITVIRQLAARGLLKQTEGDYPILAVTLAGRDFLRERQILYLPKLGSDKRKEPLEVLRRYAPLSADISERNAGNKPIAADYDEELFQRLRVLRRALAEERGVPPYVIFGDAALRAMAAHTPQDLESLLQIPGVGKQKLEWFGKDFLGVIKYYTEDASR
jgi:ATP-dependent DNA helicase RecQ